MTSGIVPLGIQPYLWSNAATTKKESISGYKPGLMIFSGKKGNGFNSVTRSDKHEAGGNVKGATVVQKMVTDTAETLKREKERLQNPEVPVIGDERMDISAVSTTAKIKVRKKRNTPSHKGNSNTKKKKKSNSPSHVKKSKGKNKMSRVQRLITTRNRQSSNSKKKKKMSQKKK